MNTIIDTGAGNLLSISKAFERLGEKTIVTSRPEDVAKAGRVILPGVGSFGAAMGHLRKLSLDEAVKEKIKAGTPLLGICLGMQILFDGSEETEGAAGLGVFRGTVRKLPSTVKVPHLGWNRVVYNHLTDFPNGRYFYFVHSYYCEPDFSGMVKAYTYHGVFFPSVIRYGSVSGVQFHPEKSGDDGLAFLRRWLEC